MGLGVTAGLICSAGLACMAKSSGPSAPTQSSADRRAAIDDRSCVRADASTTSTTRPPPRASAKPLQPPPPLTPETFAELRGRIASAEDYSARLQARGTLFHQLRRHGQIDLALVELHSLIDEVERQEGRRMAERMVFSKAGSIRLHRDYPAAIRVYEVFLECFADSRFAPEVLFQMADSQMQLEDYTSAEASWRRLVEEHDGCPETPLGWKNLALAQVRQEKFEAALSTLEVLAVKYPGGRSERLTRLWQGDVLREAGRQDEARDAYLALLAQCANNDSVHELATKRLSEFDPSVAMAQTDGRRP